MQEFAELGTVYAKIYWGPQRKSYYDDKNNPRLLSILLPIEAWTTGVTQAVRTLDRSIRKQGAKELGHSETLKSKKDPYSNVKLTRFIINTLLIFHIYLTATHRNGALTLLTSAFTITRLFRCVKHR